MIKNNRVRFIVVAMLSVLLVLYANVFVLNFLNYSNIKRDTDRLLDIMVQNDGKLDETIAEENGYDKEVAHNTRYFSVEIYYGIVIPDTTNISSVNNDDAIQYTLNALNQDVKNGYVDNFRFEVDIDNGILVFVDCTSKLEQAKTYLVSSIIVACVEFAVAFVVVFTISSRVVKNSKKDVKVTVQN